jgi:hypothetical protein
VRIVSRIYDPQSNRRWKAGQPATAVAFFGPWHAGSLRHFARFVAEDKSSASHFD